MHAPADRTDAAARVNAALLDFFEAPGKYQLSLRQPAFLFASIRQVLQVAAGRTEGATGAADNSAVMEAAAFFIRAALLYPGANHYVLMGLPARTQPVELKDRYRLLMRLIHPDFAAAHAQTWPSDAAVRVNRAYEVLSSPVLRAEYDEQLLAAESHRPLAAAKVDVPVGAAGRREPPQESRFRLNKIAVWALAISGSLVGIASFIPGPSPTQLVQKADAPVALATPPRRLPAPAPPLPQPAVLAIAPAAAPAPPPAVTVPVLALPPASPPPQPIARTAPPIHVRASATLSPLRPQLAPAVRPMPPPPVQVRDEPRRPVAVSQAVAVVERVAEPPAPAPVPAAAAVAPPPPPAAVVREEAPRPLAAVAQVRHEAPSVPPSLAGTEPSLSEAQPLLTQLLQSMEGGSGEQILRLLEGDARRAPAALALSRQYEQLVGRARPVRLAQVEFRSEAREGVLLVTGRLRLHAGDPSVGSLGSRMSLRAEFVSRGGKVLLTGLAAAPD